MYYHDDGDIFQGDVGVYAKDDAIVNRANVSFGDNSYVPLEANEFIFCTNCGTKLPADAKFCMMYGKGV